MDQSSAKLLTLDDAARATGLTVKALRRRIERGTLTSVSVHGRRRIELAELVRRGLLVGLDADLSDRPAPASRASQGSVLERLAAIEERMTALESQLASLAAQLGARPPA